MHTTVDHKMRERNIREVTFLNTVTKVFGCCRPRFVRAGESIRLSQDFQGPSAISLHDNFYVF